MLSMTDGGAVLELVFLASGFKDSSFLSTAGSVESDFVSASPTSFVGLLGLLERL
jgi:hypothetical protein